MPSPSRLPDKRPGPDQRSTVHPPSGYVEAALGAATAESDVHYQALAEAIPHIVFLAESDGQMAYYNQKYHDYAGATDVDDFERRILHPDDFERTQRTWEGAIARGEPYEIEYRLRRASDGQYRWHLGRALPVRGAHGRIVKWFGTCTDIHEQKTAEQEVRRLNEELEIRVAERTRELEQANRVLETEIGARMSVEDQEHAHLERLHRMVEILPFGVIVSDEEGRILHVNERFPQNFGLPMGVDEILFQPMRTILKLVKMRTADPKAYLRRIERTVEEGQPVFGEEIELATGRILRRDYLPIFVKGVSRGHVFLYRDITQERRVDAAKSEFMSLASHQLRTPLTSVRWALGRLGKMLQGKIAEPEDRLLETAKSAVAHMSSSIDTMLQISRVEAGKITLQKTDVPLGELLRSVLDDHRVLAATASVTVSLDCPEDVAVLTDARLLEEIFINLLSNAVKYTPAGGRVDVSVRLAEGGVYISVADTGYGIPLHQQRKIFTKFFRGDNILRMHTDGTGLGLYLSHRLAQLLGADLSFQSREGEGTTFTLRLPEAAEGAPQA